jgi:hypothetical protein
MSRIAQAQALDWGRDYPAHPARHSGLSVNDFPQVRYSLDDIKRAGDLIAGKHPMSPEVLNAFQIANNWREAHAYPMRSIRCQLGWYLRNLGMEGVTGARLKRMQAIRRKLVRITRLGLHDLQDLGGCRAIVARIDDAVRLADALRDRSRHSLGMEQDYIRRPKSDGYRSHHLMFDFRGWGDAKRHNNRRIEVQIRTRLQHSWATAVEAVGLFRNEALKNHAGDADWLRLFLLMSAEFAIVEGCPEPPNVPKGADRINEIRRLDKKLGAAQTLENLSHAVKWTDDAVQGPSKPTFYLIRYENATNQVTVSPYFAPTAAMLSYETAESFDNESGNETANIVLVEADKLENLKEAYPNYFGEIQLFKMQLTNITAGIGAREYVVRPQESVRPRPKENPNLMWLKRRGRQRWS